MQYRLRTLLSLLVLVPPIFAGAWIIGAKALVNHRQRQQPRPFLTQIGLGLQSYSGDSLWLRLPNGRPAYMADVPLKATNESTDD